MPNRIWWFVSMSLLLVIALSACGGQPSTVENGEGNVEAVLVTYSDSARGFSIGYPSTWTQDTNFANGIRFVGGDSSMTLEFVTPTTGVNAMTYAQNDVTEVSVTYPGFNQLSLAPSTEVQNAIILGYTATGTSTITTRSFTAHDERYYIPLSDSRIAVLTVISPDNLYDREGVRDIALTFQVTR